jgi:hypothetical protein
VAPLGGAHVSANHSRGRRAVDPWPAGLQRDPLRPPALRLRPVVTEPSLEGRWTAQAQGYWDYLDFERLTDDAEATYRWRGGSILEDGETVVDSGFATLVQAEGILLLDLAPHPDEVESTEWLRLHSAYVVQVGDSLHLDGFSVDSVVAADSSELEGMLPFDSEDRLVLGGPAVNVLAGLVTWAGRPGWTEPAGRLERDPSR